MENKQIYHCQNDKNSSFFIILFYPKIAYYGEKYRPSSIIRSENPLCLFYYLDGIHNIRLMKVTSWRNSIVYYVNGVATGNYDM